MQLLLLPDNAGYPFGVSNPEVDSHPDECVDQSCTARLRDTDARYKRSMGEGALAPLINDSVDLYDRYEHVGEGVFIAPLIKGLRPPAMLSTSIICASATKRGSTLSN